MKKIIDELEGLGLDWAVMYTRIRHAEPAVEEHLAAAMATHAVKDGAHPSRDWAIAGPLIQELKISFREERPGLFIGYVSNGTCHRQCSDGPDELTAAMRAYVQVRVGQYDTQGWPRVWESITIDVPDVFVESAGADDKGDSGSRDNLRERG